MPKIVTRCGAGKDGKERQKYIGISEENLLEDIRYLGEVAGLTGIVENAEYELQKRREKRGVCSKCLTSNVANFGFAYSFKLDKARVKYPSEIEKEAGWK